MLTHHRSKLEVHRHASDDVAHDCGRACAQMIISSLTQGVVSGVVATTKEAAAPVPVTQAALQTREATPVDTDGRWFTDPDEMLALLKQAPELQAVSRTDWRLAVCPDLATLMVHVGLSLQRGMPAVLNFESSDHWVVVRSVDEDKGLVTFLEFRDPVDQWHKAPKDAHTYFDACATNGTSLWEIWGLSETDLGHYPVKIGDTPPATYQGKFLAVVYGPPPNRAFIDMITKRARVSMIRKPISPVNISVTTIADELRRVDSILVSSKLARLLTPVPPITLRTVRDIGGSDQRYLLASLFNKDVGEGLVGVFSATDGHFGHLRFTTSEEFTQSLSLYPTEDLWWRRQKFVPFGLPYFPFRRTGPELSPIYTRLIDNGQLAAAQASHPAVGNMLTRIWLTIRRWFR